MTSNLYVSLWLGLCHRTPPRWSCTDPKPLSHFEPLLPRMVYVVWLFDSRIPLLVTGANVKDICMVNGVVYTSSFHNKWRCCHFPQKFAHLKYSPEQFFSKPSKLGYSLLHWEFCFVCLFYFLFLQVAKVFDLVFEKASAEGQAPISESLGNDPLIRKR